MCDVTCLALCDVRDAESLRLQLEPCESSPARRRLRRRAPFADDEIRLSSELLRQHIQTGQDTCCIEQYVSAQFHPVTRHVY